MKSSRGTRRGKYGSFSGSVNCCKKYSHGGMAEHNLEMFTIANLSSSWQFQGTLSRSAIFLYDKVLILLSSETYLYQRSI